MSDKPAAAGRPSLLSAPPAVINVGLDRFAADLSQAGVAVTQVAWQPPARGNARLAALLAKLGKLTNPIVEAASQRRRISTILLSALLSAKVAQ